MLRSPCTQRDTSQNTMTCAPRLLSSVACACIALISSSTERSSRRALYQPETRLNPCFFKMGTQYRGVAREFAPELDAFIAGKLRLAQAGLERVLLAELRQVVVRPGQGIDADANHLRS
jgi:hypothetical protein